MKGTWKARGMHEAREIYEEYMMRIARGKQARVATRITTNKTSYFLADSKANLCFISFFTIQSRVYWYSNANRKPHK